MIKIDLKKLKPYGKDLDDGGVELSFILPVPASEEARKAAVQYVEGLGLKGVQVAAMEAVGKDFSYFVVYAHSDHSVDFTKFHAPKGDVQTTIEHKRRRRGRRGGRRHRRF